MSRHVHLIIRNIVGRVHVSKSTREVAEYAVSRLRPGAWEGMTSLQRFTFLRDVVTARRADTDLYRTVMRGF